MLQRASVVRLWLSTLLNRCECACHIRKYMCRKDHRRFHQREALGCLLRRDHKWLRASDLFGRKSTRQQMCESNLHSHMYRMSHLCFRLCERPWQILRLRGRR